MKEVEGKIAPAAAGNHKLM